MTDKHLVRDFMYRFQTQARQLYIRSMGCNPEKIMKKIIRISRNVKERMRYMLNRITYKINRKSEVFAYKKVILTIYPFLKIYGSSGINNERVYFSIQNKFSIRLLLKNT